MKIQTLSIVIGTAACNAHCPFCVSSMTGFSVLPKRREIDLRNFRKACLDAKIGRTTTVLFTGKGEPTLYPEEIVEYLDLLTEWEFPFIELQTNALEFGRLARDGASKIKGFDLDTIEEWYDLGLDTVAVSTVGIDPAMNAAIYDKDYPELERTIGFLHEQGFTVRLCVMMMHGGVAGPEGVVEVVDFCKANGVEQLKMQTIRKPDRTSDDDASSFVAGQGLSLEEERGIVEFVEKRATRLMTLMHGAVVYDFEGQNLCLTDCLTVNKKEDGDSLRSLIYYADGELSFDWQHRGAILLRGRGEKNEKLAQLRRR